MELIVLFICVLLAYANAAVLQVNSRLKTQYKTINDAIKAASPGDTIVISAGTYKEKVTVDKDSITLRGSSYPSTNPSENTVSIEAASYATSTDDDSATLFVTGSNFRLYNINVTNSAGSDSAAVAISSRGTKNGFYTVAAHGSHGVFYAHVGSLFVGRSYIQGAEDVVYGRTANAWFQGVKLGATGAKGTLSAQGRITLTDDGYFVFDKAKVVLGKNADAGTKGSVYLGRPWGDYARAIFQNSNLGNMINDAGWIVYTTTQTTSHVLFGEYSNTNGGALGARVSWAKSFSNPADISSILPGYRDWVDSGYIGASAP